MGFFNTGKKVAKFTFISMPLSLFGVNQLRMGNQQIKALWQSNFNPICPNCDHGVLLKQDSVEQELEQTPEGDTRLYHPWVCSNCQFGFLEEDSKKKVRASAARYRNERIKTTLSTIEYDEIQRIAKSHRVHSRALFLCSLFGIIGFFYMLYSGASLMLSLNWLSISFSLWVLGMKKSFRCWQVLSGQLFVEGAFWHWFQTQKWIV